MFSMYLTPVLTLETHVLDVLLVRVLDVQVRVGAPRDGTHVAAAVLGVVGGGATHLARLQTAVKQRIVNIRRYAGYSATP